MKIRIGVEGGRRPVLSRIKKLDAPILISANSLWNQKAQRFSGWLSYIGFDIALDSGGFVAMKRYGGYRWTIPQYVALAKAIRPSWWAQMDFCCEPEIASDYRTVWKRIGWTVNHLRECQRVANGEGVTMPLPVLQGWHPEDYCRGPIYDEPFKWPALIGVGSVCRRQVNGNDGILAVIEAIDRVIPPHCKLHLFGVKSTALSDLVNNFSHRIASTDSMAWSMQARWTALKTKRPCNGRFRAKVMEQWYNKQINSL